MRGPDVHQFLPNLGFRDAVGNHTLATKRVLEEAGIRGEIWAEDIQGEHRAAARRLVDYPRQRTARKGTNLILYQASTGSSGMASFLAERPEQQLIYYHNITPARFFEPYEPHAAVVLERGRLELRQLCARVTHGMANSEFSARELREMGVENVEVIPPYAPLLEAEPDPSHSEWLRSTKRGVDLVFVSRVSPHKGHMHLLRAFAALRANASAPPRLFVVGAWGPPAYMAAINGLRQKLGVDGMVFCGSITDERVAAHYREADIYLCLSEHEGFGVPVIEAMRAGTVVVAYEGGAVAETLDGAGVLLHSLDPLLVAEVVDRVAGDEGLRKQIIDRQHERVLEIERFPRDETLVRSVRAALERR
jgi:glycosyltransferase involved in cell wall biosynthesis